MMYEDKNCIDAGTEYCPCHLAATKECILCSQLSGKEFCDCKNWKGTCILQEYNFNADKPKSQRKTYIGEVINKAYEQKGLLKLEIQASKALVKGVNKAGSFIFLRREGCMQFYDTPISIMNADEEKGVITVAIEIRGIKTKTIQEVIVGERILLRGPFWNGIFGLRELKDLKNSKGIILGRGIGIAPMLPVIETLLNQNNEIYVIIDTNPFGKEIFKEELEKFIVEKQYMRVFDKGELTKELKDTINNLIEYRGFKHIHIAGADILSYRITEAFKDIVTLSCCNNAKMCCGEGVCGSCSSRYSGHVVRRLCKVQCEPNKLFEGRRLI